MQTVLSIDASTIPLQAVVIGIDGRTIQVLEHHTLESNITSLSESLKYLGTILRSKWQNAVMFFAPSQAISFNLSLPFKDNKNLKKIIEMEVQDVVPFEVSEFVIHQRHIQSLSDHSEDVHVGLVPNEVLIQSLLEAKHNNIEPYIISTPGCALQGIYELFEGIVTDSCVMILERPNFILVAGFVNRKFVYERILPANHIHTDMVESFVALTISYIEQRYETPIDHIYRIVEDKPSTQSLTVEGKTVENLNTQTLLPLIPQKISSIALLGSIFGQDYPAPTITTNFRTGEFAYSPRLQEATRGLKVLLPYLGALLLVGALCLATLYGIRSYALVKTRNAIFQEVQKFLPGFTAEPGTEATALQGKTSELQNSLKELGSPLASSPLEILLVLSEDLTTVEGLDVQKITVKNGEVRVEGTVPNYKTLDKLETLLKRRKGIFCKVKNDTPATGGRDNNLNFQVVLGLCE